MSATKHECNKLFSYFKTEIVKKALNINNGRAEFVKSIIRDGVDKYVKRTAGPDDRCASGQYYIQLYKANNPEEIAEYIVSGFGFEVQRELF